VERPLIESTAGTRSVVLQGREATQISVSGFSLLVEDGPDRGACVQLGSTSLRVGTQESNDLVLADPTASRTHAVLSCTPEGVKVEDLNSKNGTWLEGVRIQSAFVPDGGRLRFGSTTVRVSVAARQLTVFPEQETEFEGMIGQSRAMRDVFALVRQLSEVDLPVAITGETGCGKELVARALHRAGHRRNRPYLVLDCGNLVPGLLRSELFGHEKGAFTGADQARRGILEEAQGGTVLLDEVGEIDSSLQPSLLRALEVREIQRIGSRQSVPVSFRVVSATNKDMEELCKNGLFRSDLMYRLSCVRIHLPSLRERPEDIPLLARHFIRACAARHGQEPPMLTEGATKSLLAYEWPGNVRELRNAAETLSVLAAGRSIQESDVAQVVRKPVAGTSSGSLKDTEKAALLRTLEACGWNRVEAAQRLKIARSALYRKMARFGIKPPNEDPA
jgi:two-component system response regulator GlrR